MIKKRPSIVKGLRGNILITGRGHSGKSDIVLKLLKKIRQQNTEDGEESGYMTFVYGTESDNYRDGTRHLQYLKDILEYKIDNEKKILVVDEPHDQREIDEIIDVINNNGIRIIAIMHTKVYDRKEWEGIFDTHISTIHMTDAQMKDTGDKPIKIETIYDSFEDLPI